MNGHPVPAPELPSIYDGLRTHLEDDNLAELPPSMEPAPSDVRRDALRVLANLVQDAEPSLCHGDASTWNLLAGPANRWLLIDPRGVSGEAAYDAAVLALKLPGRQTPGAVATEIAETCRMDPVRVRAWIAVVDAARIWSRPPVAGRL